MQDTLSRPRWVDLLAGVVVLVLVLVLVLALSGSEHSPDRHLGGSPPGAAGDRRSPDGESSAPKGEHRAPEGEHP